MELPTPVAGVCQFFTLSCLFICCHLPQVEKFSKTVECIGQDTISTIAKAGPEAKVGIYQSAEPRLWTWSKV